MGRVLVGIDGRSSAADRTERPARAHASRVRPADSSPTPRCSYRLSHLLAIDAVVATDCTRPMNALSDAYLALMNCFVSWTG